MKYRDDARPTRSEPILRDLRALLAEAEKETGAAVGEPTDVIVRTLERSFAAARERCAALYPNARRQVVAGAKGTGGAIRNRPHESLAAALGAGVLLGVLLDRRTR